MKKKIKIKKLSKEIQKNIYNIIINKFSFIFKKKNIININYIKVSKNFLSIKIYLNFINTKNIKIINKNINILQKYENYIKNILKKKIYFKFIPKIYFIYDEFYIYINKISNIIKTANNFKN